jgi:hypothetical protein
VRPRGTTNRRCPRARNSKAAKQPMGRRIATISSPTLLTDGAARSGIIGFLRKNAWTPRCSSCHAEIGHGRAGRRRSNYEARYGRDEARRPYHCASCPRGTISDEQDRLSAGRPLRKTAPGIGRGLFVCGRSEGIRGAASLPSLGAANPVKVQAASRHSPVSGMVASAAELPVDNQLLPCSSPITPGHA